MLRPTFINKALTTNRQVIKPRHPPRLRRRVRYITPGCRPTRGRGASRRSSAGRRGSPGFGWGDSVTAQLVRKAPSLIRLLRDLSPSSEPLKRNLTGRSAASLFVGVDKGVGDVGQLLCCLFGWFLGSVGGGVSVRFASGPKSSDSCSGTPSTVARPCAMYGSGPPPTTQRPQHTPPA